MKPVIRIVAAPAEAGALAHASCSLCALKHLCLPGGLGDAEVRRLDKIISRRRVERDGQLFRMGERFRSLYAIRFGHFKTFGIKPGGEYQILGFHMSGEVLGMDAIGVGQHHCGAVALEDSEVCEIPFAGLEQLFVEIPQLLHHFHWVLGQELRRQQERMIFLGSVRADRRFAAFLLDMSVRYGARGYSGVTYRLRMSREDIGLYLGLTIESISRLLAKFKQNGWIQVCNRELEILDHASISALAGGGEPLRGDGAEASRAGSAASSAWKTCRLSPPPPSAAGNRGPLSA